MFKEVPRLDTADNKRALDKHGLKTPDQNRINRTNIYL